MAMPSPATQTDGEVLAGIECESDPYAEAYAGVQSGPWRVSWRGIQGGVRGLNDRPASGTMMMFGTRPPNQLDDPQPRERRSGEGQGQVCGLAGPMSAGRWKLLSGQGWRLVTAC